MGGRTSPEYHRAYYAANKDRILANNQKSRLVRNAKPQGRASELLAGAAFRARQAGLVCTLTPEWVAAEIARGTCAATGMAFDLTTGEGHVPRAPSIDQIVPGAGYTPENCRLVTSAFNRAKSQWTDAEFAELATAFLKHWKPDNGPAGCN